MNSFLHLWQSLLLGGVLGILRGFLGPLRPRWCRDLLLVWALFALWAQLVFGFCGGDLRFAYSAGLLTGFCLWHYSFGQWLQPVFDFFWKGLYGIFCFLLHPFKKIWEKTRKMRNFLYATGKKWVTIKCNKYPSGHGP